jgi:hypothetical protein
MWARALTACLIATVATGACSDDTTGTSGAGTGAATSSSRVSAGPGAGGTAVQCFDYASFTPTPEVSFADDVMPILATNCNSVTCHGNTTSPDGKLYLGKASNNDEASLDGAHAALVNVDAVRAPTMKRVAPGDAENSFLMIKLDAAFSCPQVTCSALGCGSKMPYGSTKPQLMAEVRDVIRSWIQNGAPRSASGGAGGTGGAGGAGGNGGTAGAGG